MSKGFLGILFCGGKGRRLATITDYISKALVPVYDRPVFMYPLAQLEASRRIDEIVLLTNTENGAKLQQTGYRTIIQNDAEVCDMFSGLAYIRKVTGDNRPAILMPCDNISDIVVDSVVGLFIREKPDIAISIRKVDCEEKLREMGVFDVSCGRVEYRPRKPKSSFGVIAPYVVKESLDISGSTEQILNHCRVSFLEYAGPWFDVGDVASLALANNAISLREDSGD